MTSAAGPRYRILETIGKGGMGEVCLAEDSVLDRKVAVKFLVSEPGDDTDVVPRLLREARAAAALDHPFICKIYEVTHLEGRPCIVMEYVPGETVERRLRGGPVALAEGLRLAEEIAEAIEAAHKRRLVHRDLKPANVIVTEDNHIKVMDFGLAARLPSPGHAVETDATIELPVESSGALVGTPAYMSPEQVRGDAVDWRADIFAFGILLYEMFSGHHPFRRHGLEGTLAAVLEATPELLHRQAPWIPETAGLVVARMLMKDPALRHQSLSEVRLDLRRLSGDVASSATWVGKPMAIESHTGHERPFVARETEQAELLRSIRQARDGRGSIVLLTGEAGAGKTRLAQQALHEARRLGFLSLTGRCSEQEANQPLVPYVEVLEEAARLLPVPLLRETMGRAAPELAKLVPELHRVFDQLPEPLELPPDMQQRFLFTNIREFLARCARLMPVVIFLDDLQWADESTVQLTQHLAPQLEKVPLLLIAAYRDIETAKVEPRGLTHAVSQVLQRVRGRPAEGSPKRYPLTRSVIDQLVGQRLARLVPIGPMPQAKVGSLLAALGEADPPHTLVKKFFEATGGNPFFVEELFRHLNEERGLFTPQGVWRRDLAVDDIEVPAGVRIVISRRLQRMSPRATAVLSAAAVIGPHFELDVLEAVADVDGHVLLAALEHAEQAHLVKGPSGRQERRWRFEHQLIRQTLASEVPQAKRLKLHLRIADAMERLTRTPATRISDIAHHLYCAGALADSARTSRALISAGDAASDMYATSEAVQHYSHALEILDESPGLEADRPHVEERLADLLTLAGDRAGALEHYRQLGVLYENTRNPVGVARTVRKTGMLYWQAGDRGRAVECYQRALGTLRGQADTVELAQLCQELGLAAFRNGENQKAIEWADRALASADAAMAGANGLEQVVGREATAARAHANNTKGVSLARLGQLEAARERIEQSVSLAREHGLLDVACRGYANLGVIYGSLEPRRAIEASLSGLELATKIGAASLQPYIYANLAAAYCALTDRCETEGLVAARTAVNMDRELGQLDHLAVPLIVLAQIHQCHGDVQQALDAYREAMTIAERIGEPQLLFPCYDGLATVYLDRGETRLAEQYLEKARQVCERAGVHPDSLLVLPFLC